MVPRAACSPSRSRVVALAVLGVILAVLAIAWLLAQIPRTNAARPFRLHDDATTGLTVCPPDVLATAVADEVTYLRRRERGQCRAEGHLSRAGADPQGQRGRPYGSAWSAGFDPHQATQNLSTALDTPVAHLGVQLDIDRGKRTTSSVTL